MNCNQCNYSKFCVLFFHMFERNYFNIAFLWGTFIFNKKLDIPIFFFFNEQELQNTCGQLVLALIPYKDLCNFDCIFCIPKCQEQTLFKD